MTAISVPGMPVSVTVPGAATEATLADIKADVALIKADVDAINLKSPAAMLTKRFDQIVPDFSGLLTKVYTTKLAGVAQEVLTITYTDATKTTPSDWKVV